MKFFLLTLLALGATVTASQAASPDEWYAIQNVNGRCETNPDSTPAKMIETAQAAKRAYVTHDPSDPISGKIVQVTIDFPKVDSQISY